MKDPNKQIQNSMCENFTGNEIGSPLKALFITFGAKYLGMINNSGRLMFSILMLLFLVNISGLSQDSIPGDFCISEGEYKLYNLINDYRKAMNLDPVPLSRSLSYVAKQHALDLVANRPDTNTCNFHSWSDKGNWTACCFEKEIKDRSCMINKPGEITKYPGVAYEIVYWENKEATADRAFDQWQETTAARSLITNFKEWEGYTWNALGVGIYQGFAIAWFGELPDVETKTLLCGSNKVILNTPVERKQESQIVSSKSNRFYLIYGSFKTMDDARVQLKKFVSEGFKKAKIVAKDNKFRISLSDYSSMQQANVAKRELPAKFKGAWILPF